MVGITAQKLIGIPDQELELREALGALVYGGRSNDIEDLQRQIIVTPYGGAYGPAGVVIVVEGSPPRALVLVTIDNGRREASVCVFSRASCLARPVVLDRWIRERYSTKSRKRRAYDAVLDYLTHVGVFDGQGQRNLDVEAYTSPAWREDEDLS